MRRVVFALTFLGLIVVAAVTVAVVATMPDDNITPPAEPPLPDGNTRGDGLLDWAAEHPDRARAPEYLEDL